MQVDVALQMNGAGQKHARGNHHPAAARAACLVDRLAKRVGAIGLSVRPGAEARDLEFPAGELRGLNPLQDPRVYGAPGIFRGPCAGTGESGTRQGGEGMAARVVRHQDRWYGRALACVKGSRLAVLNIPFSEFHIRS